MIDVQRQVWDMMKMAEEANMTIIEIKGMILKASINNQMMNATNIFRISEDLQNLIQCDMENRTYQIQRILANKLNTYKGKENKYIDDNIKEIQELYKIKEHKPGNQGVVEENEVILIKLYEVLEFSSTTMMKSSFINNEVENLLKYIKFIQLPTQTRLFKPLSHYQSLWSREEQNPDFWKEVVLVLVDNKHNTETLRNSYPINIYQGGLLHKPYFIAINNQGQVIIGPNKKMVTMYVVGELEVLI